ncbi:uncharacterized protein J4E84_010358 [Alternaria hordeiaustralica]|uniref:uncharacterized protein n=1 Tax=Alternaria hordeiaustralica TaxID=1187925 RepID=UPI0020C1D85C|nr:uncharacterized protein J4E84_010358 [Alternaria hordeiaustralica]KAI4674752.1 hypothetical protein J4E84_010358 [Alternaria hordeiaustralica]
MSVDLCPSANIRSKRDLKHLCEVEDIETGAFKRCTFAYIDDHERAWFGQTTEMRKYDLTVEDLNRLLQQVPDEKIYPLKTTSLSTVPEETRGKYYIKRPKLLFLDDEAETKLLPQLLPGEAEVLQLLEHNPHPNIIRFHGCTVNRSRVTGIALDQYSVILKYRHEDVPQPLDIEACMRGIRSALKHLHLLGLAHNDLNPSNIALDTSDNPFLLDFGSCRRFGEVLLTGGTPGWIDENYSTTAQWHDELAAEKIEAWFLGKAQEHV